MSLLSGVAALISSLRSADRFGPHQFSPPHSTSLTTTPRYITARLLIRRSWRWFRAGVSLAVVPVLLFLFYLYTSYVHINSERNSGREFVPKQRQWSIPTRGDPSPCKSFLASMDRRSHFNALMQSTLKELDSGGHSWWKEEGWLSSIGSDEDEGDLLQICFLSADVPLSAGHGGTATAFLLLSEVLARLGRLHFNVTLVGMQRPEVKLHLNNDDTIRCDIRATQWLADMGIHYDCLQTGDMQPDGLQLVSTYHWEMHALAVLRWLDRNPQRCNVIHGHEWGGVFTYLALVLQLDPDRYPSLRLILGTHGGHMWSQIGLSQRPSDLGSLRVDHMEKLSVEWADTVLSPSRYMLGYFATRGWRVEHRLVIPNIVERSSEAVSDSKVRKPVWQILFVGRLEERKGIRILMDVIARLSASQFWKQKRGSRTSPPSVVMLGPSAVIDGQDSEVWINSRIRAGQWAIPVTICTGMNRSDVLARLQEEGVLLVLPSLQENLPYVLAEAALAGAPVVTFDVGGSREVLELHADDHLTFCSEVSVAALYQHVLSVLSTGSHFTSRLAPSMAAATELWLKWHHVFQRVNRRLAKDNNHRVLVGNVSKLRIRTLLLDSEDPISTATLLHEICTADAGLPGVVRQSNDHDDEQLVFLLPTQFEVIPSHARTANATFARLFSGLSSAKRHMRGVAAMTFGVRMDNLSVSYPSAPTWLLYSRDPRYCEHQFPIIVRRLALCQAFAVDVQVFPVFQPWILSDVLSQQSLQLVTHPDVLFQYRKGMSVQRMSPHSQCHPYAVPVGRYREANMLDHFHRDVSEDMRDLYFPRKTSQRHYTDLITAIRVPTVHQSNRGGWSFSNGSIGQWKLGALNDDGQVYWFTWYPTQFRYGCNELGRSEPYVDYHSVVHPCRSRTGGCCGDAQKSSSLLRYTFSEEQSMTANQMQVHVTFSAQQRCGDGTHIRVLLCLTTHSMPEELFVHQVEVGAIDAGHIRGPIMLLVHAFQPGTYVDIIIDPLFDQDCDGVFLSVEVTDGP